MTDKLSLVLILLNTSIAVFGQNCLHTDLSNKLDFQIDFKRIKDVDEYHDSCVVKVTIIDKVIKRPIQTIKISSTYFFGTVFKDCTSVKSYVTGKNIKIKVNGGPLYNFYIQNQKGLFSLNKFLTEQMSFFSAYINKKEKILTTFVHAGVNRIAKTTYKFNVAHQTWKQIKLIYLGPE